MGSDSTKDDGLVAPVPLVIRFILGCGDRLHHKLHMDGYSAVLMVCQILIFAIQFSLFSLGDRSPKWSVLLIAVIFVSLNLFLGRRTQRRKDIDQMERLL